MVLVMVCAESASITPNIYFMAYRVNSNCPTMEQACLCPGFPAIKLALVCLRECLRSPSGLDHDT